MNDSAGPMALSMKRALLFVLLVTFCVPAPHYAARARISIEIILDASFTMNERLDTGRKKLDVAKEAILRFLDQLEGDVQIALRVYGHMALRELQDCTDSELLVPFATVARNKSEIARMLRFVYARGMTPLTSVLREAADDMALLPSAHKYIILLADGPETCSGDPCGITGDLKNSDGRMIVTAIGFKTGDMGSAQLRCIASVGGGRYFPARNAVELENALEIAAVAPRKPKAQPLGEGTLIIEGVDTQRVSITSAVKGEIQTLGVDVDGSIVLPAGVYTVSMETQAWKSVIISGGQTTVLSPGRLKVLNPWNEGHKVFEWESRKVVGVISVSHPELTVLPGEYEVMFGKARWRVNVPGGEPRLLKPGIISVENISQKGIELRVLPQNTIVGNLTRTLNWMPLPPGEYLITIEGQSFPFNLKEDQRLVLKK